MKTILVTVSQQAMRCAGRCALALLFAIGFTVRPQVVTAQTDQNILPAQVQVAAPFGPQNGDGPIANGNLVFPISLGAYTLGHYSVQPPPSGTFDEGFGQNVKVFPSIRTDSSG